MILTTVYGNIFFEKMQKSYRYKDTSFLIYCNINKYHTYLHATPQV